MIVKERVLLATPGHRDKDWMPPPTHQQLKNSSHATTKKVLAGEGLQLTSRVLVYFINSKLYKMKTTIISAQVRVNVESNAQTVVMNTADEFDFINAQNGFAHGKRKMLVMSMKQLLHFINEADSELGDDIAFMAMATDPTNQQFEDLLMGATVDVELTERAAGEQYEANGQQVIAVYDSIHISKFTIDAVAPIGRYAIDYNSISDAYATTKERRTAWNTTRKALRG